MSITLILSVLCLIGVFILTIFESSLRHLHRKESNKIFNLINNKISYQKILKLFNSSYDYDEILFSVLICQSFFRALVIVSICAFLFYYFYFSLPFFYTFLLLIFAIFCFFAFTDYLPRIIGGRRPAKALIFSSNFSIPFLILTFPFAYIVIELAKRFWKKAQLNYLNEPKEEIRHEIFEILQDVNLPFPLNKHNKKLIESVMHFQKRIAREIMVPRMNMFCLNAEVSIKDAVKKLKDEGYSRVPVYKDNVDNIIGVLMYKDILTKYIDYQTKNNDPSILDAPISGIIKKVIYTPETKPISNLLQDFRKKQVHLAIVVDEFGGTEGIVTIEDILEEIVGEIEDEYDDDTEELYNVINKDSWIADAQMSILDAEESLGIELPKSNEYDTIGGFIFNRAGTIPSKGFLIKLDNVEIEVLKSNERRVEKVKIKKIQGSNDRP